jgi:hypothetical protein
MVDNLALYSPSKDFRDIGGDRTYEEWSEQVRELTQRRKAAFLEFNVKEGWGLLCELLEVDVPDVPFPRLNDKEEFLKLWNLEKKQQQHEVFDWRVWVGAAAGMAVPFIVGYFLTKDGLLKT